MQRSSETRVAEEAAELHKQLLALSSACRCAQNIQEPRRFHGCEDGCEAAEKGEERLQSKLLMKMIFFLVECQASYV